MNAEERKLLLLLSAATFFNQYDIQIFSLALKQIQAELLIPEAQLGIVGSLIRLGSLPAFAVMLIADRVGRRTVLLWTIVGYTFFTGATAFAPDYQTLVALQFAARMFMSAEYILAFVFVVEEFRPENRGWGVGVLGTLALLGRGVGMALFGFIEDLPYGWRSLYALGVGPMLAIAYFRRRLGETRRFEALDRARSAAASLRDWLGPIRSLLRLYPGRFVAVGSLSFLWSISNAPVDFYLPKFMQEFHGWSPGRFATIAIVGGGLGITGQLIAGWISDQFGRKPSFLLFTFLEPLMAITIYTVVGNILLPVYVAWVFASTANDVLGRTYGGELFPTSYRSTASGALAIVGTTGSALGLVLESALFGLFDDHWTPIRILVALGFFMPFIVVFAYPETSGRTLEEISPEEEPRISAS